ncbi:uncharacterized protein LOC112552471, partial [Pogonomyrmex barbatus]|uniref:Uncharacterized protein LOC112552471 n=1 Tax=Pogonomyrmex barbatus TaxID=144034 RepID=A0A8N1S3S5_9HYME
QVQNLHYLIREDWRIIRTELESKIILKHAHNSQIYNIYIFCLLFTYLTVSINFVIIGIVMVQFLPNILDIVLPLDEPRPRKPIIMAEYFVLHNKYFYTKILHEIVLIVIYTSILFATSSQLLVFSCHSFGMFKICSHRIEYSIEDSVLHVPNPGKKSAIYRRIMHVVIAHRRAMDFCNIMISSFNIPYCIITIVGLISLSINLYGFVEAVIISKNMENFTMYFFTTTGHLVYMFVANYIGQKVIDYNNELFKLSYDTSWYLMPVSSQKLILFLMQKTGKEFYFTIGSMFIAKLESFATVRNKKNRRM